MLDATGLDDARDADHRARRRLLRDRVPHADTDTNAFNVRYFAPSIEVTFCGHATIATAVALGERRGAGRFVLHTKAGEVPVDVPDDAGRLKATLTSVEPDLADLDATRSRRAAGRARLVAATISTTTLPPKVAYAGAWHPVIAAKSRERLADLHYDFERPAAP